MNRLEKRINASHLFFFLVDVNFERIASENKGGRRDGGRRKEDGGRRLDIHDGSLFFLRIVLYTL